MSNPYSQTTPEIERYADLCQENGLIEPSLYNKHKVNRGLRDLQGRGVLTGLTEISEVNGFEERDGTEEFLRSAWRVQIIADQLCTRYNHESAEPGYDEHVGEKCAYFIFL